MLSLRRAVTILIEDAHHCHGRSFSKFTAATRVKPFAIRNTNPNKKVQHNPNNFDPDGDIDVDEVRKEFRREVKHEFRVRGDISETDLDLLNMDSHNAQANEEHEKLRSSFRKSKMYKRHFREILGEKEVSVLTYAEKEKIRYLHSTNPEEWTPEKLSEAFPVTVDGVLKLVNSVYKVRTVEDIQRHDKRVADRIDKIRKGEIEMTPDLVERMKMREKMPLSIGAVDPYDKNMLLKLEPVKFVGEFQRLVTPPVRVQPDSKTRDLALSLPSSRPSPPVINAGEPGLSEPDLGDFYNLEPTPESRNALRRLKVSLRQVMTFEEFKTKMKLGGGVKSRDREVQHIAKLSSDKSAVKPTTLSDFEKEDGHQIQDKGFNHQFMNKFQSKEGESTVTGDRTMGDTEQVGHRKQSISRDNHHQSERSPAKVNIPNTSTNHDPGVIYQKGKSFYDDNGEFLYKVV